MFQSSHNVEQNMHGTQYVAHRWCNMRPEEQLLIVCARRYISEPSVFKHHVPKDDDSKDNDSKDNVSKRAWDSDSGPPAGCALDWNIVYTLAQQHGVAPMIHAVFQQNVPPHPSVPPEIRERFEQAYMHNVIVKSQAARQLERILAFFAQRDVRLMLIKGAACDLQVYAQPWYTTHDVDLVIGARRGALSREDRDAIRTFFSPLRGFEYDFYEHHDVTMNQTLAVDFGQIWSDARSVIFQGHPVWVMCPEDMLLAACINSCRKRYFRLKSLLDIAGIVGAHPTLDWTTFVQKARAYDCHMIAYTALFIARNLLNVRLPAMPLDKLCTGSARRAWIHLLSQRMSLSAFSSIHTGGLLNLGGRSIAPSLLLHYSTLHWGQIYRKVLFAVRHDREGMPRTLLPW